MRISDFNYDLPDGLIARYPTEERRGSRLLEVGSEINDRQFADLPALLREGDLLVFNDTKVIAARLHGYKETGGRVEILIERITGEKKALAHIRASKSPKPGGKLRVDNNLVTVTGREGEIFALEFSVPVLALLERVGEMPLPPYLERDVEESDSARYQTVYARDPGAVAAPTAGLHFDEAMLEETEPQWVLPTHYDNFFQPRSLGLAILPTVEIGQILEAFRVAAGPDLPCYLLDYDEFVSLPSD